MDQKKENGAFIKGLFCGVLLVLLCMAGSLLYVKGKLYSGHSQEEADTLELNSFRMKHKMKEMEQLINQYYLDDIDTEKVEADLYTGLMDGLGDPYSVYYTEEELATMEEAISGAYAGIGAVLKQNPQTGEKFVVSCYDNTPAQEAGLLPGDIITGWNGNSVEDMELSDLVAKIKTDPDEHLTLEILRGDTVLDVEMTRREIEIPTVETELLEDGIGYIRILEFDSVSAGQFEQSLLELEEQGVKKLIIDVRDNPGGILQVVCDMLDQILPEGLIVYTEDKYGERTEYFSDEEHQFTGDLVVLTNENSASASEIFAGAIQDYGMGSIVGTTTFGKGIVQKTFYLSDATGIKLTVAKYYTPKGHDIHEKGITPDIEVELKEEWKSQNQISHEEDNQLQEALEFLRNQ